MGLFRKNKQATTSAVVANVSGRTNVAMDGYDPVSFFDNEPVNGDFQISSSHEGATYFFKNQDNKKRFEANSAKFAPQYGGYCAFGVSVGAMLPVDIKTAQVYKDKLYINLNGDILKSFNDDIDGIISKADAKWPSLVKWQ